MKSKLKFSVACAFGLIIFTSGMFAHHSIGEMFDFSKTIVLKGTLDQAIWMNPHAYLLINVKGANGAVESWAVELAPPNALNRAGFDLRKLQSGGEITVTGFASKPGAVSDLGLPPQYETSELAPVLRALSDRRKANRLIHPIQVTLPDGRTITGSTEDRWRPLNR